MLVCVESRLMAEYADDAVNFIRQNRRIELWLTGPHARILGRCLERELAAELGYRYVSYFQARMAWWDLIVFAEYRAADRFHPDVPRVLVNHFLGGGKILGGKEYRFARKLWHWGRPLFNSIFEASAAERDRAIAADPALALTCASWATCAPTVCWNSCRTAIRSVAKWVSVLRTRSYSSSRPGGRNRSWSAAAERCSTRRYDCWRQGNTNSSFPPIHTTGMGRAPAAPLGQIPARNRTARSDRDSARR